jgi:lysophospholipase L1-like esterase
MKSALPVLLLFLLSTPLPAQDVDTLANQRVVFLGDSITQGGGYITFTDYYLQKLYPQKKFDIYPLGLSSETLSGLSEPNHANGAFPRPCLFERLGRVLEKVKPDKIIACYGINDGIYLPLDDKRFGAFKAGVQKLIEQCKTAGVKEIFLLTPPIYDITVKGDDFNYDTVMTAYADWEKTLDIPHVHVIDLHTAMRKARIARAHPFSRDHVHPDESGHLLMARTLLGAFHVDVPDESLDKIHADELYQLVDQKRKLRSKGWMNHVGYTREKTVMPQPLGDTETQAARLQEKIDALRRQK